MKVFACILALVLAAGSSKAQPPPEEEEVPFEEPVDHLELGVLFDLRLAATGRSLSFMDRGLGKLRYGGSDMGEGRALLRLAQLSFTTEARFTHDLGVHLQVNLDAEPERGEASERLDLVEAFFRYRVGVSERNELRGKAGLFFPPISLEHPGTAWTTLYTITPSALNAWVGEEVRSFGAELTFARVGLENEISFTAAAFGWNDPGASLLAFRGWAAHDRQTGLLDQLPLPPLPSITPGGVFETQAPWAEPVREVDDRAGWYAAASWDRYRRVLVNAIHYDNRARPDAFDSEQYGWRTRFTNGGVLLSFADGTLGPELALQFLGGDTWMGHRAPGLPKVTFDFRAAYALFTAPFERHRLSFRYDWFETVDRDDFQAIDDNDEEGYGLTLAYQFRTAERQRLALELLRVVSDRGGRAFLNRPTEATEWLFQLSYRVGF